MMHNWHRTNILIQSNEKLNYKMDFFINVDIFLVHEQKIDFVIKIVMDLLPHRIWLRIMKTIFFDNFLSLPYHCIYQIIEVI